MHILPYRRGPRKKGNKLEFGGDGEIKPLTLTFNEVISHEPSLAGRLTTVLHVKSLRWKKVNLVVKISWPDSERVAENPEKATSLLQSTTDDEWALNHLPRVLYAQHVVFNSDSTH